jgi:dUTP pyrophosphatase
MLHLKFKLSDGAKLPSRNHKNDAGIDIYTNIKESVMIEPSGLATLSTGVRSEIPDGYCILIWDRSGLGSQGIAKCAGVIDSGYRGEWFVTLANHHRFQTRTINPGDKIVQGILTKVIDCKIVDVDQEPGENGTLANSERGEKGYGSSGNA